MKGMELGRPGSHLYPPRLYCLVMRQLQPATAIASDTNIERTLL